MSMRQLKITKSITNRESQSLEKYLQEIGKVDLYNAGRRSFFSSKNKTRRPGSIRKTDQSQFEIRRFCCQTISKSGFIT